MNEKKSWTLMTIEEGRLVPQAHHLSPQQAIEAIHAAMDGEEPQIRRRQARREVRPLQRVAA